MGRIMVNIKSIEQRGNNVYVLTDFPYIRYFIFNKKEFIPIEDVVKASINLEIEKFKESHPDIIHLQKHRIGNRYKWRD